MVRDSDPEIGDRAPVFVDERHCGRWWWSVVVRLWSLGSSLVDSRKTGRQHGRSATCAGNVSFPRCSSRSTGGTGVSTCTLVLGLLLILRGFEIIQPPPPQPGYARRLTAVGN